MDPKNISISDFTYELREEKIARFPLAERDASKLLIYKENNITEDIYKRLPQYIPVGSLLVFNDTKVIEARILFRKPTGASIEIFCLEPDEQYADTGSAMLQQKKVWWKCLVGGVSKWKPGQVLQKEISFGSRKLELGATYIEKQKDCFVIEFSWSPQELNFAEVLHLAGIIPLPPYIKRETEKSDAERYQTIYADHDGSVAAPTAGLHFTEAIFKQLSERDIQKEFVTLHVGAGTFKPVKSALLAQHDMHAEWIAVTSATLEKLMENLDGSIIPVGTTSLRTIESLYWLGVKIIAQPHMLPVDLVVHQWDAYELKADDILPKKALQALLAWLKKNQLPALITKTQLLITPGYQFRIIKALITNFHQPQSTLLLLVAALAGEEWKTIYQYAMAHDFRFLSYGDGCLIFRRTK